jgi:hypothetical protein
MKSTTPSCFKVCLRSDTVRLAANGDFVHYRCVRTIDDGGGADGKRSGT